MFSAIVIGKGQAAALASLDEAELPDGDVGVDVGYSTLNYKDALAITGKSPVVRKFPMVPGIALPEAIAAATELLDGTVRGRIVVDVNR